MEVKIKIYRSEIWGLMGIKTRKHNSLNRRCLGYSFIMANNWVLRGRERTIAPGSPKNYPLDNFRLSSSVGGGARAYPIGLKSMQNSTFFVLLRPIFAPKLKIAPPTGFGSRSCEGLAVIWTRIVEFFGSGAQPKSVKTFFFLFEITWCWPEKPFEFRWRPFFFG